MDAKATYTVVRPLLHGGQVLAAGASVDLTPRQAKFLRLGGFIAPPEPAPAAPADPAAKKTKKGGDA